MYIICITVLTPYIESLIVGRLYTKVNFGTSSIFTAANLLSCGSCNGGFIAPIELESTAFNCITELENPLRIGSEKIIDEVYFGDSNGYTIFYFIENIVYVADPVLLFVGEAEWT